MSLDGETGIDALARGLIDRTLPKREWTHAGHFAAALWLIRHRLDLAAPDAIRAVISRYNEATGTLNTETEGYHHTITLASLRAATDHLAGFEPDTPIHIVLSSLMASRLGRSDWADGPLEPRPLVQRRGAHGLGGAGSLAPAVPGRMTRADGSSPSRLPPDP